MPRSPRQGLRARKTPQPGKGKKMSAIKDKRQKPQIQKNKSPASSDEDTESEEQKDIEMQDQNRNHNRNHNKNRKSNRNNNRRKKQWKNSDFDADVTHQATDSSRMNQFTFVKGDKYILRCWCKAEMVAGEPAKDDIYCNLCSKLLILRDDPEIMFCSQGTINFI